MDNILLNNKRFHFSKDDLPCLIHYIQGTGGSHFSVTMMADLFLNGGKILFLTAYPMAKDNFMNQVIGHEKNVIFVKQKDQLKTNKQTIVIESGNQNLFLEALNYLDDIDERIIFIKNFEEFDKNILLKSTDKQKLIISGNLDTSSIKKELLNKQFKTIIQFSQSKFLKPICPDLEKYTGCFWQKDKNGLIKTII